MRNMFKIVVCVMVAAVCGWLAPGAHAADKVANPEYAMWAKYKVGTWVSDQTTVHMGAAGQGDETIVSMKTTRRLVELTAEKAVFEVTTQTTNPGGRVTTTPVQREQIAATVDPDFSEVAAAFAQVPRGSDDKRTIKRGEEEITVLGKPLKCRWVQCITDRDERKYWFSDQVPGGRVRFTVHSKAGDLSATTEVTGFEVAK